MKTIFVVIFLIHWSYQYDIEHGDKSGTYTYVSDYYDEVWRFHTNVRSISNYKFFRNENGDEVTLKQPQTNIQDNDQIIFKQLRSENQGLNRKFEYYTSKGTVRMEAITHNKDLPSFSGKYSYVGDDGIRYIFSYVADSNGYRPKVLFGKNVEIATGIHIPVVPTLPPPPPPPPARPKGIGDGSLLCSLIGGGCL